jgi:hypothetical protein
MRSKVRVNFRIFRPICYQRTERNKFENFPKLKAYRFRRRWRKKCMTAIDKEVVNDLRAALDFSHLCGVEINRGDAL